MTPTPDAPPPKATLLYCHCAYAKVIDPAVKEAVLKQLSGSGVAFEAVADLCEMSARKDPALARLGQAKNLRIAACFPRAVRWLFHAAGTPLPKDAEVLNMRTEPAEDVADRLLGCGRHPVPERSA